MTHPEPVSVPAAMPPDAGGPGDAPPAAQRPAAAESYATGAGLDPALADLAEEITARLQAGEPFDPDDYEARHPQWAGQIRRMLPILQEMAELARSVAGGLGVGHAR